MLNKLLRSIGIGSARIDTVLKDSTVVPGSYLRGEVRITGGNAAQEIECIYMALVTDYEIEVDDSAVNRSFQLAKTRLCDRFVVQEGQELVMPFSILVPLYTPVSMGKSKVWVQTGLDIKSAVDPQDRDYVQIRPHVLMEAFLHSAEQLGFRLYEVDVEKASPRFAQGTLPFVQEFEFKPASGEFRGRLDELEAIFSLSDQSATVTLQIDRRARGIGGMIFESMGLDESYSQFSYGHSDLANLDTYLADAIRRFC
ncbi:sporulation protein [Slackia piriformis]|uniref:sporulation protein n=1 Tax=Slackia piriformis TaxID=626934 RepID=UPI002943DE0C|nr:sporulation protein [Slackia piriformis]